MDSVFEELYQKYHQDIFQFLFYMVRKRELAEDLVQEVYIKVLKSYHTFKGKSSEKTWLFSIARHVAIDYFRKQKGWKKRLAEKFDVTEHPIKDKAPLPEEIAMQNEEIRIGVSMPRSAHWIKDWSLYCVLFRNCPLPKQRKRSVGPKAR